MEENEGKRTVAEHDYSRRSDISFIDQINEDRGTQGSNRLGSTSRYNTRRDAQFGTQEKYAFPGPPFHYVDSKATAGSSSRSAPTSSAYGRSFRGQQNKTLLKESIIAGSSSKQKEVEDLINTNGHDSMENLDSDAQKGIDNSEDAPTNIDRFEPSVLQTISADMAGSSIATHKPHRQVTGRIAFGTQDAPSSSIARHANITYRTSSPNAKPSIQRLGPGTERSRLKGLSCTSISDVLPPACSSSDVNNKRVDTARKRPSDAEISAVRSKGASTSSTGGYMVPSDACSGSSSSSRDQVMHQPVSRRTRNQPTNRDGSGLVRTHRGSTEESQTRQTLEGDVRTFPLHEPVILPQYQWAQFFPPVIPRESSSRPSHGFHNLHGRPGASNHNYQNRLVSYPEDNTTSMFFGTLGNREGYRHSDVDAVSEVLLALERIEQDEQLLVLETSLLFSGLSFRDRHRDMRMDIDNMSYEELLALEERMGTVSTALSEEQMSKCIKRRIYAANTPAGGIAVCSDDDLKCSICQEEYVGEDEVGELQCEHLYHAACVKQWLRQKNWCPICKSSALLPSNKTG